MPAPKPYDKPRGRWWRALFKLGLICLLIVVVGAVGVILVFGKLADRYDLSKLGEMKQRSIVLDAKRRELGRMHGENRVVVPLSKVSPFFVSALLAREDTRFYHHDGVDYYGVLRAILRDLQRKKAAQGASTLTMQLARNSFDDLNDKSMRRKLVEVMLARRIEHENSKDKILEMYMNRIFFGSGIYGIERASKAYFNKSAAKLSLGQAAMLAGIIRSPNRFSPFRNWKGALNERNTVLNRMVEKNLITPAAAATAKAEDIAVAAVPIMRSQENYMMEAVRADLEAILDAEDIEDGGLRIYTTIDKDVQAAAEKSVDQRLRQVEKNKGYKHPTKATFDSTWDGSNAVGSTPYLQGAAVTINHDTGGIVAVVGGRDFLQSHFDRALHANRTIGSTIKPFVYASAFEHGLLPETLVEDAPLRAGELKGFKTTWSPQNSDGKFLGWQPASIGLILSRNVMSVRVGERGGLDHLVEILRSAGFSDPPTRTPQIYIGNMGGSLRALTSAMSVFPNLGIRRRTYLIQKIEDATGREVYSTPVLESEVLPPSVAFVTGRLLQKVVTEGTASAARSEYGFKDKAGGKTGTTNDYKDAWFVGYSGNLTTGVWVGFDQPQTISEGAYGAKLALPIWVDVMNSGLAAGYRTKIPKAELPTTTAHVCKVSGLLATDGCQAQGDAYDEDLPYDLVPQSFCTTHPGGRYAGQQQQRRSSSSGGGFWDRIKGIFR